jgi:5-methylcytosine-specific restriction endonuclease McrA/transposase
MFVPRKAAYDWSAISAYYEAGHSVTECQARFGFSNGAWDRAVKRGSITGPIRGGGARPRGETANAVARLIAEGRSQVEIARLLGVSRPTVCFHVRKLGLVTPSDASSRLDWLEIRRYYEAGRSVAACRERFGFSRSAWYQAIKRGDIVPRPHIEPIDQILAAGRRRDRGHVKSRLLGADLKKRECERCGLASWHDRPLSLELHHRNGDGNDNRLENLALLCPNCHSQTDTWGGRNRRLRGRAA